MNSNIHDVIAGWILKIIVLLILLASIFITGYGSIMFIECIIYDKPELFIVAVCVFTGLLCVVLCIGLLHKLYQFIKVISDKSEEN
jgi:hypothetical protein